MFRQITLGSTAPGADGIPSCTQLETIQIGDEQEHGTVESIDFMAGKFRAAGPDGRIFDYPDGAYCVHMRSEQGVVTEYYSPQLVSSPVPLA